MTMRPGWMRQLEPPSVVVLGLTTAASKLGAGVCARARAAKRAIGSRSLTRMRRRREPPVGLVVDGWLLHVVDHHKIDGDLARFELQAEGLIQRGEDGGQSGAGFALFFAAGPRVGVLQHE